MSETLESVKQVVALTMRVDASSLNEASSPDSIHSWDSMSHLNLMLAIEDKFGVDLDPDDIDELTSVAKLVSAVDTLRG